MNFCLPSFFNRQTHFECFREKRANGLDPAGFTVIGLHANLFGKLDLAPFSHMHAFSCQLSHDTAWLAG